MCLLDYTDFPNADPGVIKVPEAMAFWWATSCNSLEGGATLVGGLTASTDYYVVNVAAAGARCQPVLVERRYFHQLAV